MSTDQPQHESDSEGFGDATHPPIATLPALEEITDSLALDVKTGMPKRSTVIAVAAAAFLLSGLAAFVTYWVYWWKAIHISSFATSSGLIRLLDPRPGSWQSVVAVCVMTLIGIVMTAVPCVAAYNAWNGARWSRWAGVVACGTSFLAYFVITATWLALPLAGLGTLLLFTPPARANFDRWNEFLNPPPPDIDPPTDVAYGRAPRFRV